MTFRHTGDAKATLRLHQLLLPYEDVDRHQIYEANQIYLALKNTDNGNRCNLRIENTTDANEESEVQLDEFYICHNHPEFLMDVCNKDAWNPDHKPLFYIEGVETGYMQEGVVLDWFKLNVRCDELGDDVEVRCDLNNRRLVKDHWVSNRFIEDERVHESTPCVTHHQFKDWITIDAHYNDEYYNQLSHPG